MAKSKKSFTAEIEDAGGGGAFVRVPFDVEKVFGAKRVKVFATIDGLEYRGSLVRMGSPDWMLIVVRAIRESIRKDVGDEVSVTVQIDEAPRNVETPSDFLAALKKEKLAARFEKLSFTHKREFVQWIEDAKKKETRERRIGKAVEMIFRGEHR